VTSAPDPVVDDQRRYYESRAPEYDHWWNREGPHDRGPEINAKWFRERGEVVAAFNAVRLGDTVLEIAAGTGIWTERIAKASRHVTVVDASIEMLALNRYRLGPLATRANYVLADVFEWEPENTFDSAVFCFWLSHVPKARVTEFLIKVSRALRPGGKAWYLDDVRRGSASQALDPHLPPEVDEVVTRRTDSGGEFRIIKNFRSVADVQEVFSTAGLTAEIRETATYFQYGVATRSP